MKQYQDYLQHILDHGYKKGDRTGTGTISAFGYQMTFDLQDGFPIPTTKKVDFQKPADEMLWMLRGGRNVKELIERGVHVWTDWALIKYAEATRQPLPRDKKGRYISESPEYKKAKKAFTQQILTDPVFADNWGDLGPVYGAQWRNWRTDRRIPLGTVQIEGGGQYMEYGEEVIDQIQQVLDTLRTNPDDRRMIVSGWNAADLPNMALPPCHMIWQVWTRPLTYHERLIIYHERMEGKVDTREVKTPERLTKLGVPERALSLQMYIRSNDTFLGAGWNIPQYALLTHLFAHQTNMVAEKLVYTVGDAHIYLNHLDQVKEMLAREPYPLPRLVIKRKPASIDEYTTDDFELVGYRHHEFIKAPIAV